MKFLPAMLIAGLCAFSACSDDEGNGEVFSDLTTEEHKAKLEDEGIAFAQNMDAVADLKLYDVVDVFMNLQEQDQQNTNVNPTVAFGLDQVNELRKGAKSSVNLKALAPEEKGSISAEFAEQTGVYTWDGTGFVYAAKEGEITYIFPVGDVDATITVNNFSVQTAANQDQEDFELELPLSLDMSVTLGTAEICSYALVGEWYDNDTPKLLKETIKLEVYTFSHELSNNKSTLSMGSSFDNNGTVIFANNITIEGNVDYSAIMAELEAAEGEEDGLSSAMGQEILTKANAWFQLGNLKAEGVLDVKGLMNGMSGAENIDSEEASNALMIELLNNNVKLYVKYADSDEIIAKSEFYLNTYNGSDWIQEADGSWTEVPATFTEPDIRMIFADDSAVDSDFFNTGFEDMIDEIDALIAKMEANFGEETPAE